MINSVLSEVLSVVNIVFDQIFARTVDLMIDIPRLSSSSVTKVLLRIANATFKTLMIICIFTDRVLKSSYASVYEFYPAKHKTVSLYLHFTSPFDVFDSPQ